MKNIERKPKYAMRKLSIGLVSCMLGFALIAQPSHSFASGGAESEPTAVEEKEEKLEGRKNEIPEVAQSEKLEGKKIENDAPANGDDVLQLGEEIAPTPVQNPQSQTADYSISWKLYPNTKNLYDQRLEGTKFNAKYTLVYNIVLKNGKKMIMEDKQVVEKQLTVGTPQKFDVDLSEVNERLKAKNPDIDHVESIADLYLPVYGDNENYFWGNGSGGTGLANKNFLLEQNMNTKITYKQKENSIILDEDKGNINLLYFVKGNETAKPETGDYIKGKDSNYVYGLDKFEDGKTRYLSKTTPALNRHIEGNTLGMYSGYTGKYKEFRLVINRSLGINQQGDRKEEHAKYYTFDIKGNDLDGWTVTLGSNLKEKDDIKDTTTKFTTREIYDDTLDEGVREIKQAGQDGIVRDTFKVIYLPGKNGTADEEVERKLIKNEKIQQLVEQIIRVGTRKKNNPSGPIVTPGDDDSPIVPIDPEEKDPTKDEDEYNKLIKELLEEIEKEADKENEKPADKKEDSEKGTKSENKAETTNPKKEEKSEEGTPAPIKRKPAGQKVSKEASPKTGVTGSAAIAALGLSSLFASLGLRKKND